MYVPIDDDQAVVHYHKQVDYSVHYHMQDVDVLYWVDCHNYWMAATMDHS
jgi:hypothetical protein